MHSVALPVNVSYDVAKSLSQKLKEGIEWLGQAIKSHPFLAVLGTALVSVSTTVFAVIIGPISVSLFQSYIGDPWTAPDVTVNDASALEAYYDADVEDPSIYSDVIVYNAGDDTAEACYVTAEDVETKENPDGVSNQFNVPPSQYVAERVIIPVPKVPKGHREKRTYHIRAVCRNDVSSKIDRAIIY
jgi:hypothetical protein